MAHDKYRWAVVMSCGCGCHTDDGVTGHVALCCSIPNGLKRNNPEKYKDLEDIEVCKQVISDFENNFPEGE